MVKAKAAEKNIEILALDIQQFNIRIIGDSPFISHAWDEKAKRMMLEKQTKKSTNGREIRRPSVDFANSLYWLTEKPNFDGLTDEEAQELLTKIIPQSKFGFPVIGFKAAAVDGAYQQDVIGKKTTARGAFHILGDFAEIEGTPTIREDVARIAKGGTDLRYRAEFKTWATTLTIKYNAKAQSAEQIISYFNVGGFSNGIGDWRPAKGGSFGTFHVE